MQTWKLFSNKLKNDDQTQNTKTAHAHTCTHKRMHEHTHTLTHAHHHFDFMLQDTFGFLPFTDIHVKCLNNLLSKRMNYW